MFGFQMPRAIVTTGVKQEEKMIPPTELFVKIEELALDQNSRVFKHNHNLLLNYVTSDNPELEHQFRNERDEGIRLNSPRGALASSVRLADLQFLYRQEFYKHHAGETIAGNMEKIRNVLMRMKDGDRTHELHDESKAEITSVHAAYSKMIKICRHWTVYSFINQQEMPLRFMLFDVDTLGLLVATLKTLRLSTVFQNPFGTDIILRGEEITHWNTEYRVRYDSYFAQILKCQAYGYFPPLTDFVRDADDLESKPQAYRIHHLKDLEIPRQIVSALSYFLNLPIPKSYHANMPDNADEFMVALMYFAYSPMLKELNIQYKPKLTLV